MIVVLLDWCRLVGRADVGMYCARRVHSFGVAIVHDCETLVRLHAGSDSDVQRKVVVEYRAGKRWCVARGWCRHVAYWDRGCGYAHADGVACWDQHVAS